MREFIFKSIFCFIAITAIHFVLAQSADGTSDYYYKRFTSPQQASMILGTSRAAQGVIPSVIDSVLDDPQQTSSYNFSFTLQNSPYGKVYYEAVEKKLSAGNQGYFILTVDPWCLSTTDEKLLSAQHDKHSILSDLSSFSSKPNYQYLINNYKKGWGSLVLKKVENFFLFSAADQLSHVGGSWAEVKEDGWLDVNTSMEPSYVAKNIAKKTKSYIPLSKKSKLSEYRMKWLQKQIEFLKNYGAVYLVRLPVHQKMIDLENEFASDFDSRMKAMASINNIEYINLIEQPAQYNYTDGNHLYKTSAHEVSKKIGERLLAIKK